MVNLTTEIEGNRKSSCGNEKSAENIYMKKTIFIIIPFDYYNCQVIFHLHK